MIMNTKQIIKRILQILVAIGIIVYIYSRTDTNSLLTAISQLSMPLLLSIFIITFLNMLLQGVKWWILIRKFAPDVKLSAAVRAHLEGAFYSIALPGMAAHDAARSVILAKDHSASTVWAASFTARLTGLIPLLTLAAIGVMLLDERVLPKGTHTALAVTAAVAVVLGVLSFSKKFTRPFRGIIAKIIGAKFMDKLDKLRQSIYIYGKVPKTLALAISISFVVQATVIFVTALMVLAVSNTFYFAECMMFAPLADIAAIALPITPGSIGIREGVMTILFERLNFNGEQIALFATISIAANLVKLVGVIPVIFKKKK